MGHHQMDPWLRTIKCAYRRACCFLDNDNYQDRPLDVDAGVAIQSLISEVKNRLIKSPLVIHMVNWGYNPTTLKHRNLKITTNTDWWFGTCFIFYFIYGMSSFPLTNSYFSRWLLHHQPGSTRLLLTIINHILTI